MAGFERDIVEFNEATFCRVCNKQFKNEATFKAHLPGKKHLKAAAGGNEQQVVPQTDPLEAVAYAETMIKAYLAVLDPVRRDTFMRVEAKSMMTDAERQAMVEQGDEQAIDEIPLEEEKKHDDVDDERIYNPLKLPLGWDGKPIPFWLYKMHGLVWLFVIQGVEYECEICGGYIYKGRKAFDMHFTESRHAWGLKCLGMTNDRSLRGVTSINDAYAVWEKVLNKEKEQSVDPGVIEEFEDADGNVYNRKIYEDLKRQGLI